MQDGHRGDGCRTSPVADQSGLSPTGQGPAVGDFVVLELNRFRRRHWSACQVRLSALSGKPDLLGEALKNRPAPK